MKVVLFIDMPEYCGECKFFYNLRKHCCKIVGDGDCKGEERIQDNCPLRKLPERKEVVFDDESIWAYKRRGWNECLDAIQK